MFEQLIVTYACGGKARKKCGNPNCSYFIHARSQMCVCGYEFRANAREFYLNKELKLGVIEKKSEDSKNKKKCDKCHALVGPRTKICACGFDFAQHKKPTKEHIKTITDEDRRFAIAYGYPSPRSYVYCPSGSYSGPKSVDDEGFDCWVECHIIDDGRVMTPTGYRYILRQHYSEEKLQEVLTKFNLWVQNKLI